MVMRVYEAVKPENHENADPERVTPISKEEN